MFDDAAQPRRPAVHPARPILRGIFDVQARFPDEPVFRRRGIRPQAQREALPRRPAAGHRPRLFDRGLLPRRAGHGLGHERVRLAGHSQRRRPGHLRAGRLPLGHHLHRQQRQPGGRHPGVGRRSEFRKRRLRRESVVRSLRRRHRRRGVDHQRLRRRRGRRLHHRRRHGLREGLRKRLRQRQRHLRRCDRRRECLRLDLR